MAHFYGKLFGKGTDKSVSTRTGTKNSGLITEAMGYRGVIETHIYHSNGEDHYEVILRNHPSGPAQFNKKLCSGVLDTTKH